MSAMTNQEIRDYVREHFELDEEDVKDVLLNRWISEGLTRIQRRIKRWTFYETDAPLGTVLDDNGVGVAVYAKPLKDIAAIQGSRGALEMLDRATAEQRFLGDTPGEPRAWSDWGNQIRLWPTPNAVYLLTAWGMREPKPTSGEAGEKPDIPDHFHDLLLLWVMYRAYLHQDDPEMAQVEKATFDELLIELATDDQSAPTSDWVFNGGKKRAGMTGELRYPWE